jgi:predicted dehydrogenase
MADKVRIGLIGCGDHSNKYLLPNTVSIEEAQVVACADVDEVRARQTMEDFGIERQYLDYEEMLKKEELDAVIVAPPHHVLKEAALASIQSGRNVFVEKPMGTTKAEAEEVTRAGEQAGVSIMVGYCMRYAQGRLAMKALLDRGVVGDIALVTAGKGARPLTGWLADPKTGGGQLLFLGVHITDQILWMLNAEPARVYSEIKWHPETGADQSSAWTIRFKNDVIAEVLCTQKHGESLDYIEVIGSAGKVRCEWPTNIVRVHSQVLPEYSNPTNIAPMRTEMLIRSMFQDEMADWVSSLVEKRESPIGPQAGINVLEIIDAVLESDRTGQPVNLV